MARYLWGPPCFTSKAGANIDTFFRPNKMFMDIFSVFFEPRNKLLIFRSNSKKTNKFLRKEIPDQAKSNDKITVGIVGRSVVVELIAPNGI